MWSFHTDTGEYLGQIPIDSKLHIGRTYGNSVLDLKIYNVRVSRKQIFMYVQKDKISCRVDGINPVYYYSNPSKNLEVADFVDVVAIKKGKGENFDLYHNEMIEFNIFKKLGSIKIVICKSGLPSSYNFYYLPIVQAPQIKRRRSSEHLLDVSPKKVRRVSSMGGLKKDESDYEAEVARISIVDALGEKFCYEAVMNDPEHCQTGGSRVGNEFQASLPLRLDNSYENVYEPHIMKVTDDPLVLSKTKELISKYYKFSSKARKMGLLGDTYLEGISLYSEFMKYRPWNIKERSYFLEASYQYPKMFEMIADYINKKLKLTKNDSALTRQDCNVYYYAQFKGTHDYNLWKESFMTKESFSAGLNMSFKLQAMLAEDKEIVDLEGMNEIDDEDDFKGKKNKKQKKKKRANFGRRGKRSNEMAKLVEAGLIKPGPKALYLMYQGTKVECDLLHDGSIQFEEKKFESASSWSYYAKKQINPKVRSDNGWSSVQYDGHSLSYYRSLYDPGMKTAIISSAIGPMEIQSLPPSVDDFHPTLETVPVSAVNNVLREVVNDGRVVLFPAHEGYNVRSTVNEAKANLQLDSNGHFVVEDEDKSSRKFNSLFSWFKNRNIKNQDFFADCEVLCFPTKTTTLPKFQNMKTLFYLWKTAEIEATRREEQKRQKLLDGKRATNLRLNGIMKEEKKTEEENIKNENWSKYDRYCICRSKYIESNDDDWLIQCSKSSSYCHGWVHPKCFGLYISKVQSEHIQNFTCPLCSFDGVELVEMKENKVHSIADVSSELKFLDINSRLLIRSIERSKKTEDGVFLKRRHVKYLPDTAIRSRIFHDGKPIGWFLGKVVEAVNKSASHPLLYRVEYSFAPNKFYEVHLEHSPDHMLEKDWEKLQCFRSQDASWRLRGHTPTILEEYS